MDKNIFKEHISFHMPGHKGRLLFRANPLLRYDITEIPDADNLLHPEGWLRELTDRISTYYGSYASRILVGGSTSGCLSMVLGAAEYSRKQNDCITNNSAPAPNTPSAKPIRAKVQRNAHISVFNALELAEVEATYFSPILKDGIPSHFDTDDILQGIEQADFLILTYPFYQGGLYDLEQIIQSARQKNPDLLVLIDEAHGAHLVLEEKISGEKLSALSLDADIVVQSLHKTLPALGSSAVLHYGNTPKGQALYAERHQLCSIEWFLKALQTTSPSYLLLAGIQEMMDILETEGEALYRKMQKNITSFYQDIKQEPFQYLQGRQDHGKILLKGTDQDFFTKRGIYPEMQENGYLLFMASIANTKEDFDALAQAVIDYQKIDNKNQNSTHPRHTNTRSFSSTPQTKPHSSHPQPTSQQGILHYGKVASTKSKMSEINTTPIPTTTDTANNALHIPAKDALGLISLETIVLYPPGSPIIVPGELFTKDIISLLGNEPVWCTFCNH